MPKSLHIFLKPIYFYLLLAYFRTVHVTLYVTKIIVLPIFKLESLSLAKILVNAHLGRRSPHYDSGSVRNDFDENIVSVRVFILINMQFSQCW